MLPLLSSGFEGVAPVKLNEGAAELPFVTVPKSGMFSAAPGCGVEGACCPKPKLNEPDGVAPAAAPPKKLFDGVVEACVLAKGFAFPD